MASRCASLRKILDPVSGSAALESWSDLKLFGLELSIYLSTQPSESLKKFWNSLFPYPLPADTSGKRQNMS